jgi:hypothetical protein
MGVEVPDDYTIDLILSGGAAIDTAVSGQLDLGLPTDYNIAITELPAIELKVTELPKINLGVDPVDLNLAITKIPDIRAHLPANFAVGFSVMGMELACIRLCGEAQVITEEFRPNPCEVCGPRGADGVARPTLNAIDLVAADG